jgi:desulfoferrodoxin-like iron-binding protein
MSVDCKGQVFYCKICGNEVIVTKVGGGTLVCCGQDMVLVENGDAEQKEEESGEDEE